MSIQNYLESARELFDSLKDYARLHGYDTAMFEDDEYRTRAIQLLATGLDSAATIGEIEGIERATEMIRNKTGEND